MTGLDPTRRRAASRATLVATVILVTSLAELPERGSPPRDPFGLAGVDKWSHLFGYAVLARLVAAAVDARTWPSLLGVACLTTCYGATLEVLQRSLAGRAYEHGDVLANAVGAVLGVVSWRATLDRRPDGLRPSER